MFPLIIFVVTFISIKIFLLWDWYIVIWFKSVWFSHRIPKHSFIFWTLMRDRLTTRDRHMFFSCPYSHEVWSSFFVHQSLSPPLPFHEILLWVRKASVLPKLNTICNHILQNTVYMNFGGKEMLESTALLLGATQGCLRIFTSPSDQSFASLDWITPSSLNHGNHSTFEVHVFIYLVWIFAVHLVDTSYVFLWWSTSS